jgi:hypothetical protein
VSVAAIATPGRPTGPGKEIVNVWDPVSAPDLVSVVVPADIGAR